MKYKIILAIIPLSIFLITLVLNPNPFGNNPDAVADESFFLTSSLSAIQKITLPGWEFSRSGSFYGGMQVYLDLLILLPILAIIWIASGSILAAKLYIAINSGTLLHALRLINGLIFLFTFFWFVYLYFKRKLPKTVAFKLLLIFFLLLGNSLFIGIIHTAKVWALYSILEIILGIMVIIQETTFQQEQRNFIEKQKYIGIITWLTIFIVIQNVIGISNVLWIVYAIYLGHFKIKDFFYYIKKKILWIVIFLGLQLSFIYRSYLMFFEKNGTLKFTDVTGSSLKTAQGAIDWAFRLWRPIEISLKSQPILVVYFILAIIVIICLVKKKSITNKLYLVAVVHPILIFLMRHALFGLSAFPRYILPLTIALSLSIVAIADWKMRGAKILSAFTLLTVLIISTQTYHLYWQPSSEKIINEKLTKDFNSPNIALILDGSAGRLSLPLNKTSLKNLTGEKKNMERYKFLLQYTDKIDGLVPFKSSVVFVDETHSVETLAAEFKKENKEVWVISADCKNTCQSSDDCQNEQACFAQFAQVQEITTWNDYLTARQLGSPYFIKKIY